MSNKYMESPQQMLKKIGGGDKQGIALPRGLPNYGNTCFLNSVIQQLYLIQPVRQMVFKEKSPLYQQNLHNLSCLKSIFRMMESSKLQKDDERLSKAYQEVIKFLEKNLPHYHFQEQYDSLQTFMLFYSYFSQKDEEFEKLFEAEYLLKCQCSQSPQRFLNSLIDSTPIKCSTCNTQMIRKFQSYPQYLILKGVEREKFIKDIKKDGCYYRLESANMYNGNGKSGHYYALGKYGKKLYLFNDSQVRESKQAKFICSKSPFAIYKKVQTPHQGPQVIIDIDRGQSIQKSSRLTSFFSSPLTILMAIIGFLIFLARKGFTFIASIFASLIAVCFHRSNEQQNEKNDDIQKL